MPYIETIRNMFTPFGGVISLAASLGGAITTAGGYRIHTFTTVGNSTFTASASGSVQYLIVGGGGTSGCRHGGGGGAGGLLTGSFSVSPGNYTISVAAGALAPTGNNSNESIPNGGNSTAFSLTAVGGGSGGSYRDSGGHIAATSGGSGGGAVYGLNPGGSGTAGQS